MKKKTQFGWKWLENFKEMGYDSDSLLPIGRKTAARFTQIYLIIVI